MGLWRINSDGLAERFIPSEYVFGDMDKDDAAAILGRFLDVMWVSGKLSDSEIVEIIGFHGLYTHPPTSSGEK